MTAKELEILTHEIGTFVRRYVEREIGKAVAPLIKRLDEQLQWKGTWAERAVYGVDSVVNHDGHAWVAKLASIGQTPGADPDHWQLMVRRGKPGRDAKDLRLAS